MKLTTQQIDQLYLFTRQHFVEWYDLQSELVDHLANAIETQWQENPNLTFDQALNIEFKKFGVFGFMDVIEKRQSILSKKYNHLVFNHFKEFFRLPKIILTLAITFLLFNILRFNFFNEFIFIGISIFYLGFLMIEFFKNNKIKKAKQKANQKKWLFEEIINQYGSFSGALSMPFYILIQFSTHAERYMVSDYWYFMVSFMIVIMAIINYILFRIIPRKAKVHLLETYPEYKFVKP
jgi:hypothetical protein